MTAVTAFPPIGPHEKAMQLYGYRRYASTPGFVNHTPRDTIPTPEIKPFADFAIARIDIPRHLDLTLPAATKACYWSEDYEKPKKTNANVAASTHSHSAPTSPAEERKRFLEPRAPQYETNTTTTDVAHFLRETAPAREVDAEEKLHKDTSVGRKKSLVKKTARRVLEAGNRQLPEQCQLPQWQRAPSPERPPVVERRAKSGKRYYQIVPGTFGDGITSQPVRGIDTTDWVPRSQTQQRAVRARNTPSRRERRTGTTDDEATDAYATFSQGEGPWFRQSAHYEPGTALGDPDHVQNIQERQNSGDGAMAMPRKAYVATADSRIADSELSDNETYQRAPNALSAMSTAATTRKSTSRPNYTSKARASVEGSRSESQVIPHHVARRGQSPDRFQATLNAFPPTPSNVPTRDSSIKTYAPTKEVKSVASALQARADRARARKLRDLEQVRKSSADSEGSINASNARISAEAVSGAPEPAYEHNQTPRKQKSKPTTTSVDTCPHGFNVCPHGCRHGHYEPYHPEEIAYRASLPLPPPPPIQQQEHFNHPALPYPDWSSSPSMPPPLRTSTRPTHSDNRSQAGSNTTTAAPHAHSSTDERDLQIQLLQFQIDELRQRDLRMNAALALLTSASTGMGMNFTNLFSPAASTGSHAHANAQAFSAAAVAGAAAGVAAAQAQQAIEAQQAQQHFQNSPAIPTRNDSTNSRTSATSEKRTSGESRADVLSFTSFEDGREYTQQEKLGGAHANAFAQANALDMYMMTRRCSLTPPVEES